MGEEVKEKKPNKFAVAFHGFCRFLYNPDDHTVMGRGGESWGKIIVFYFFFYSALACFFAVCLYVMLTTLDPDVPTVTGRTNKPVLAIDDPGLFTLNFKDKEDFDGFKAAALKLKGRYDTDNNPTDQTKKFTWNADSLKDCSDVDGLFTNTDTKKEACLYMSLNRMYAWEPFEANPDKHLAFKCSLDEGKTGSGNLSPPFKYEMQPPYEEQALEKHYPWKSMKAEGRQPVVGVKITMDMDALQKMDDGDSLTSYIKCYPYIRQTTGEDEQLPGSRSIDFTVKFTN